MLCRSSNWQKIEQNKFETVFQIGFNIEQDDLQLIEIKDYLVSIDLRTQKKNIKIKPI